MTESTNPSHMFLIKRLKRNRCNMCTNYLGALDMLPAPPLGARARLTATTLDLTFLLAIILTLNWLR
jgi:hypothetical protein